MNCFNTVFCTILYKPKNDNSKTNTSFVTSHCLVTTPFKWLLKWRENLQSTFRKRLFVLLLDGTTHRSKQRFYMFHNWQKKFMGSLCLSQAILNVQSICRRAATANQLKPIVLSIPSAKSQLVLLFLHDMNVLVRWITSVYFLFAA